MKKALIIFIMTAFSLLSKAQTDVLFTSQQEHTLSESS